MEKNYLERQTSHLFHWPSKPAYYTRLSDFNLVSVVAVDLVDQKQESKKKKIQNTKPLFARSFSNSVFFSIFQNYAHDSHKPCLRLSNGPRRIPQHSLSACTGDSYFFRRATSDEGKGPSINDGYHKPLSSKI